MRRKFQSTVEVIKDMIDRRVNTNKSVKVSGGISIPISSGSGGSGSAGTPFFPMLLWGVNPGILTISAPTYMYAQGSVQLWEGEASGAYVSVEECLSPTFWMF